MSGRNSVVFWSGNAFDGLPATDHHLARALSREVDVWWVDPPQSVHRTRSARPVVGEPEPGLHVLQVPTLPAASRSGVRQLVALQQEASVQAILRRRGVRPVATISSNARYEFPRRGPLRTAGGVQVLHVTDDWPAGAGMMGLDRAWMERSLRRNVRAADVVSAVSVDLAQQLQRLNPRHMVLVVPNGATTPAVVPQVEQQKLAVLVGQLNERLDTALLQAVADAGVRIRVIGPRTERNPDTTARLDDLLARPEVEHLGKLPHEQVVRELAGAAVGLTPYAINDFNRASFPLKTLEYLALGLPVVSTPLESLDYLGTSLVDVAATPEEFAAATRRRVEQPRDEQARAARMAFARKHSWEARAEVLLKAVEECRS